MVAPNMNAQPRAPEKKRMVVADGCANIDVGKRISNGPAGVEFIDPQAIVQRDPANPAGCQGQYGNIRQRPAADRCVRHATKTISQFRLAASRSQNSFATVQRQIEQAKDFVLP